MRTGSLAFISTSAFLATGATSSDLASVSDLDVAGVVDLLQNDWQLPCMAQGFETLHYNGEMLTSVLTPADLSAKTRAQYFPDCQSAHFRMFWRKVGALKPKDSVAVSSSGQATAVRRALNDDGSGDGTFSGINIKVDNSEITFGENDDVRVYRSDELTLSVSPSLSVDTNLYVAGELIQPRATRCASVEASSEYTGPDIAVADGDYIVQSNVDCSDTTSHVSEGYAYRKTPGNRWLCEEEGGVAVPQTPLCYPSNYTFTGSQADALVYYVDAWASPPYEDAWHDLSGVNTDHPAAWTQVDDSSDHTQYFDKTSFGGAVVFDGDGHAFNAVDVVDFPIGDTPFTWEWCMSVSDWSDDPHVFHLGPNSAGEANGVFMNNEGEIRHYFWNDGNSIATDIATDEINHFTITYDQSYLRGYVNGEFVYEAEESGKGTDLYDYGFLIGGASTTSDREGFKGSLYYLRLYTTALTTEEVADHYENELKDFQYRELES